MLRKPETAFWALAFVEILRKVGFNLFVVLAGLSMIQKDVEETAHLDGANKWNLTVAIRLPLLWHMIFFVVRVSILHALSTVDPVFIII